jgi:hypothetical protein
MLTLLQNTKAQGEAQNPGTSGRILGYEAGCLPILTSCTLNEMHASEVLGYSPVSASIVKEETEKRFTEIFFGIA